MKRIWLIGVLFTSSVAAFELTEQQIKQSFEAKQYQQILTQVDDMASHDLVLYKIKSLIEQERIDDALNLVEKRINTQKQNKEWQAYNHFLKAEVHAAEAEDANIFTVSGYITDALESLTHAQQLLPENLEINQALIGFLNGVPSFFGGDAEKGLLLAKKLEVLYPHDAGVMVVESYTSLDKFDLAEQKIQSLFKEFPESHATALQATYLYDELELTQKKQSLLNRALTWAHPEDEDQMYYVHMLNYEYVQNSIELKTDFAKAIDAIHSFQGAPLETRSHYEQWPVLYEAQLHLLMGKKNKAVALAKQARAASEDSKIRRQAKRIIKKGKI